MRVGTGGAVQAGGEAVLSGGVGGWLLPQSTDLIGVSCGMMRLDWL